MLFLLWTIAIQFIDVQAVGPQGSSVGFATFNMFFHNLTGVHMTIYTITDWLGLVPIFIVLVFGMIGFVQLIKRRSLWKVDIDILVLGCFYVLVIAAYIIFEIAAVNYRPILIEGYLEASYPSSTTLLVMCVIPIAIMQLQARMKNGYTKNIIVCILWIFTAFMVIGRLISGVHWFTDIIGGATLSASLIVLYNSVIKALKK